MKEAEFSKGQKLLFELLEILKYRYSEHNDLAAHEDLHYIMQRNLDAKPLSQAEIIKFWDRWSWVTSDANEKLMNKMPGVGSVLYLSNRRYRVIQKSFRFNILLADAQLDKHADTSQHLEDFHEVKIYNVEGGHHLIRKIRMYEGRFSEYWYYLGNLVLELEQV